MLQGVLPKTDTSNILRGFSNFNNNPVFNLFVFGYFFIVSIGAIPLKLILRYKHGERAINLASFAVCIIIMFYHGTIWLGEIFLEFIIGFEFYGTISMKYAMSNPYTLFAVFILALGIIHLALAFRKSLKKLPEYSYYRGNSIILGLMSLSKSGKESMTESFRDIFKSYIEPIIGIIIGLIILYAAITNFPTQEITDLNERIVDIETEFEENYSEDTDLEYDIYGDLQQEDVNVVDSYILWKYIGVIGMVLMLSGICLFLEEVGIKLRKRGAVLDLIDSEHDMNYIMKEKAKYESKVNEQTQFAGSEKIGGFNVVTISNFHVSSMNNENKEQPTDDDLLFNRLKSSLLSD